MRSRGGACVLNNGLLEKLSKMLDKRFVVLGRIPREELLRLYSRAWALLFPSINEEPLPYAVLEATAVGTIPVAFRVGGVLEIVESTPAEEFLCEPDDVSCLFERLEGVLSLASSSLISVGLDLRERVIKRFNVKRQREV